MMLHRESGVALLITTTIASAVMIGYSVLSSVDSTLLTHKHQDFIATHLAYLTFTSLRAAINQAQDSFCGQSIETFINLTQATRFNRGRPIELDSLIRCDELNIKPPNTQTRFPVGLIEDANLSLRGKTDPQKLSGSLTATMVITVRALGNKSQRRITKFVAEYKISVMKYADFGLIFLNNGSSLNLEDNIKLSVVSPTMVLSNQPDTPLSLNQWLGDNYPIFHNRVYVQAQSLERLNYDNTTFHNIFQSGIVTHFAPNLSSDKHLTSLNTGYRPEELTLPSDFPTKDVIPNMSERRLPQYEIPWVYNYPENGRIILGDLDNFINQDSSPNRSYHLSFAPNHQQNNCYGTQDPTGNKNYHPYIYLFKTNTPVTIEINQNPDTSSPLNPHYTRIFCGVILADDLTINLIGEGDFIFLGIIGVNQLTVTSDSNRQAKLHIINPSAYRQQDPVQLENESMTLYQFLEDNSVSLKTIRHIQEWYLSNILRNLYLPLIQNNVNKWHNLMTFNNFIDADLNVGGEPPFHFTRKNINTLYEAWKKSEIIEWESIYNGFGQRENTPIYQVKLDIDEKYICKDKQECLETRN